MFIAYTCISSVAAVAYLDGWADRPEFSAVRVAAARLFPEKEQAERIEGSRRIVAIRADQSGHFLVDAVIEGRRLKMLADTGATSVVLSAEDAERIGIRPGEQDFVVPVSTANGSTKAAPVLLDTIKVGPIAVKKVAAVVMRPGMLEGSLLGMSFFSRLDKVEMRSGKLVLED